MHNGIEYDWFHINRLLAGVNLPFERVLDTLVVSRLDRFDRDGGHSLDSWGERLGYPKLKFSEFGKFTSEMLTYCKRDVEIQAALVRHFRRFIENPEYARAIECEHKIARICHQMHLDGFAFNKEKALEVRAEIESRLAELEETFVEAFPPELTVVNTIRYRVKKDGTLMKTTADALEKYPKTEIAEDGKLLCYDWKHFNPSSSPQRVERLWAAGWQPTEKTDGHYKWLRDRNRDESKREQFEFYGWKCNEENLSTLPADAPAGATALAEWLTLDGRRADLSEWLDCLSVSGRIHGRFLHIGAWTQRLAHFSPNEANIPAAFPAEPTSAVERVKSRYDGLLRSLWTCDAGECLVGTDAEGIQLRILAHILESQEYVAAITTGDKANETDIHNVNKRALGLNHITRDMAKTFIYAFLLGAGIGKVSTILSTPSFRVSSQVAKAAIDRFTSSITGLKKLKEHKIPIIGNRGWFTGLDGRRVYVPSTHHVLAGMLQSGEAIIMKRATILWTERLRDERIPFRLCTWPHDEWQTATPTEHGEYVGEVQRWAIEQTGRDLGLFCPLAGSTSIGRNWNETH
jgi:DNA polymerase-1